MTTPDHSEGVNAEIRAGMARKELTQSDVASALGLSQASVNDRLKGRREWRLDELLKVATLLGVQASDLLPVPVADAGHAAPQLLARVALLAVVTLLASVTAWNSPAGTPLAVLLAVGAWYVLVRLLGAGALAVGRHGRWGGGR